MPFLHALYMYKFCRYMLLERFSYDLEKWFRYGVRYLFHQPISEKIKTWTLRFPAKENPNMVKSLFDWPIVLQYDVKAKYRLISRKFLGMTFFHPSVRLTTKSHARLYPFDKPIKSLHFRSFVFLFCLRIFISRSYENRSIFIVFVIIAFGAVTDGLYKVS